MNIEIVEKLGGNFYNTNISEYPCDKNYRDRDIGMFIQILKDFLVTHHTIKSMCNMKNFRMMIRNHGDIVIDIKIVNQDTRQTYCSGCMISRRYFINNEIKIIERHIKDTFHKLLDY